MSKASYRAAAVFLSALAVVATGAFLIHLAFASGPINPAGVGSGVLSADSSNNAGLGGSPTSSTRLVIFGSSTDATSYAFKAVDSASNPLFILRDDGKVTVGTMTFPTSAMFRVAGAIESTSGGFIFPDGTIQLTAGIGTSTITAANVSSGTFGANTGGGNYNFLATVTAPTVVATSSLLVGTSTTAGTQLLSVMSANSTITTGISSRLTNASVGSYSIYGRTNIGFGVVGSTDGTGVDDNAAGVYGFTGASANGGDAGVLGASSASDTAGGWFSNSTKNGPDLVAGPSWDVVDVGFNPAPNFVVANGHVAIGTSTGSAFTVGSQMPQSALLLYGAGVATTSASSTGPAVILQDSGGSVNNGGQVIFGASQGLFAGIKGALQNGTGPAGALVFQTRTTSGDVVERMRVNYNGNIGIGTNNPTENLSVVGHIGTYNGTAPSAFGSCGTSPSVSGTDTAGIITVGSGTVGACTMYFAKAYANTPVCIADTNRTDFVGHYVTVATGSIAVTFQTGSSGYAIFYHCFAK